MRLQEAGVTDDGAQSFACRGERHVSAAGLVMAFNPDEPHDGQSAVRHGYRYWMLHLGEDLLRDVLDAAAERSADVPVRSAGHASRARTVIPSAAAVAQREETGAPRRCLWRNSASFDRFDQSASRV
ncbi:AraC family ligand binding domain-containing protein [Streptomyces sp. NPDC019890]|uniref:AraC family ligand binding domain-containing protein n=1 Tax=Streptomyces sp. NPDC019890 TaxID=3365064 RepID=UPI0038513AC9